MKCDYYRKSSWMMQSLTASTPTAKAMGLHVVWSWITSSTTWRLSGDDERFNPDEILECDVFNPLELIEIITEKNLAPHAVSVIATTYKLQQSVHSSLVYPLRWNVTIKAKSKYLTRQVLNEKSLPNTQSVFVKSRALLYSISIFLSLRSPRKAWLV